MLWFPPADMMAVVYSLPNWGIVLLHRIRTTKLLLLILPPWFMLKLEQIPPNLGKFLQMVGCHWWEQQLDEWWWDKWHCQSPWNLSSCKSLWRSRSIFSSYFWFLSFSSSNFKVNYSAFNTSSNVYCAYNFSYIADTGSRSVVSNFRFIFGCGCADCVCNAICWVWGNWTQFFDLFYREKFLAMVGV